MKMSELAVVDVRGPLTAQRGRLVGLLASPSDEQWAAPTAAPAWSVKDVALHLVDVDLTWVARDRDHDWSGMIPTGARYDASQVQLSGDQTLAEPLLSVRGIIVLDEVRGIIVSAGKSAVARPGHRCVANARKLRGRCQS